MKSILIIGMGRFGTFLAKKLVELKNDVMVIDKSRDIINSIAGDFQNAHIGDCTNEAVLRSLGVGNFDKCFVTIGENFQSSLEITSLLKELGANYVISKANREIQAKFLLRNGADEVVYLERDMGEKLAIRHSLDNVFDYIELTDEYSIYEVPVPEHWVGNSIASLGVRAKYNLNILAIKQGTKTFPMPRPDQVFKLGEHVMVMGKSEDIKRFNGDQK
ncbi:MAG: TrkA family potassium uptake protein [Oscillospiraceae bacterium]